MKIVSKDAPDVAIPNRQSAGLIRILRKGDITSTSQEAHIKKLLRDLHDNKQWIVCDCRPELSLLESPCLSVVERGSVLFLRNLPSRESHLEGCRFKYVKSLPWLADQRSLSSGAEVGESNKIYSLNNPASILLHLILSTEWLSYDSDYSFLNLIDRVHKESSNLSIGDRLLSDVLNQSPSNIFKNATIPEASLVIIHGIDWSNRLLLRDGNSECLSLEINGGIQPVQPLKLGLVEKGPYLALVTRYEINGMEVRSCSYIPVSERKNPIPSLSCSERSFAKLFCGYAEWLGAAEGVSMGLGKRVQCEYYLADGFQISSSIKTGSVQFYDDLNEPLIDGEIILIPSDWLLCEGDLLQSRSNILKAMIRREYIQAVIDPK